MVQLHLVIAAMGSFFAFEIILFNMEFDRNGHFARECPEFTGVRPAAPRVIDTGPRCRQNHLCAFFSTENADHHLIKLFDNLSCPA